MPESEIARFRREQALREQSAQRELSGSAVFAKHQAIMARMNPAAERIARLLDEGKHEEALRLMSLPMWGADEAQKVIEEGAIQA